jgi:transketolase
MPRYCAAKPSAEAVEACFHETLMVVRAAIGNTPELTAFARKKIDEAAGRLEAAGRTPRAKAPSTEKAYELDPETVPSGLVLKPGQQATLRETLARVLNHAGRVTGGAVMAASADLYGSTSVNLVNKGLGEGFFNAASNTSSRLVSAGGICEDGMGAIMSGLSAFGSHIGVTSSYAAFIAPLEHIAARLHAIGQQARRDLDGKPFDTFIMINAHAGLKTGEDGPTHADPQALQLLEGNFPKGSMITLTPWEPQEIWPLMAAALNKRPAVLAPFITRPAERVLDRDALGLPPAAEAVNGIYPLLKAGKGRSQGTIVLQGNGVTTVFVNEVLPEIKELGLNLNVFYVASRELFDLLDDEAKEKIYPARLAREAMGITDFTEPTMHYWVCSAEGRARTLHPFRNGRYAGSGKAADVMKEAGLDGRAQLEAIKSYAEFTALQK